MFILPIFYVFEDKLHIFYSPFSHFNAIRLDLNFKHKETIDMILVTEALND